MILRNLIFQLEVIKQRLPTGLVSHHKQQASQCNGEQQHRWAAYNVNPAPAQASTEGLFQQTRLLATVDPHGMLNRKPFSSLASLLDRPKGATGLTSDRGTDSIRDVNL